MKLETMSVEELEQKIKDLKQKEEECEKKISVKYFEKIKLITKELYDVNSSIYFREPINMVERFKHSRAKHLSDSILKEKEFPFYGAWYYGKKHNNLLDVGYVIQDTYKDTHYYTMPYPKSTGVEEKFCVIWDNNVVLNMDRTVCNFGMGRLSEREHIYIHMFSKETTDWIHKLDKLYLVAFDKLRDRKVAETIKLTERIEKLCPYMNVEPIED